ncbi:DUF4347 domain-containing protein, partial [Spirulina subsalsa FACHB-351]
ETPNGTITLAAIPGQSQVKLTHEGMKLGLVLEALPSDSVNPNTPLGLRPEDLPRYLTGGSDIGSATGVEIGDDGQLWLVGSPIRLEQGEVVIAGRMSAPEVQLMASGGVTPLDPRLVEGDTTVVRFPREGGTNILNVIDSRADHPDTLLYGGAEGTISRIVPREEEGISAVSRQLARIKAEGAKLDGVAITAEGHEGNFWLGKNWINSETLEQYGEQLGQWSKSLTAGADLLIYSCFTALGELGQGFVQRLAALTGLDVAASTNATGSENYGGDWNLEYSTGSIEVGTPFTAETLSGWEGKLAILTVTNANDAGAGSLRERIGAAAAGDTVIFDTARTVTLGGTGISWGGKSLTIDGNGSTVSGNNASQVFNITDNVPTTFQNITITGGNAGAGGFGGGIYSNGAVTLTNSTVSGNSSGNGGGIHSDGAVTLTNSTVSGNYSLGGGIGGGIRSYGAVTLTNSTVSGNSSGGFGGGIRSNGTVTLTNSTVSGNSSGSSGGGISSDAAVTLTNSTIAFNTANNTGGGLALYSDNTHTINNSIIANNTAPTGPDVGILFDGTHTFNISHSLIRNTADMDANGSTGVPTNGVNGNIVGLDPRLGPLANNGGPTQTHALGLNSPALNGGSNDLATGLTTDQRGAPGARIVGGTVDMGAFEWQGFAITPVAPLNQTVSSLPANLDVSVKVTEAVFGIVPGVGASVNFTANGATGTFSNGTTVLTNGEGMAINFFNGTEALGNFSVLAAVPGLTPVTFNFAYTPPVVNPSAVTPSAVTPPVVTPPVVTPTVITPSAFTPSIPLDFALLRGIWLNPVDDMTSSNLKGIWPSVCAALPQLDVAASEEFVSDGEELSSVSLDEYCLRFQGD